jgi:hypothetical protein
MRLAAIDQEVPRTMRERLRHLTSVGVLAAVVAAFAVAAMASVGAAVSPASGPAAASQYERKVTICHRTHSKKKPFRTIRVSENAVPAHLRHGDHLGPCANAVFTMCHKTANGKKKTVKVRGSRRVERALRRGDKLGKCKAASRHGGNHKNKGKKKGKKKG